MRRWITYPMTVFALSSILLAVAMSRRSYSKGDWVGWHRSPRQFDIYSSDGVVMVAWGFESSRYSSSDGWHGNLWPVGISAPLENFKNDAPGGLWHETWYGFHYEAHHHKTPSEFWDISELRLPWYFLVLYPACVFISCASDIRRYARQQSREKYGSCKICGHDLRASPSTCPKCGADLSTQKTPPPTAPTSQTPA